MGLRALASAPAVSTTRAFSGFGESPMGGLKGYPEKERAIEVGLSTLHPDSSAFPLVSSFGAVPTVLGLTASTRLCVTLGGSVCLAGSFLIGPGLASYRMGASVSVSVHVESPQWRRVLSLSPCFPFLCREHFSM